MGILESDVDDIYLKGLRVRETNTLSSFLPGDILQACRRHCQNYLLHQLDVERQVSRRRVNPSVPTDHICTDQLRTAREPGEPSACLEAGGKFQVSHAMAF